MSSLNLFKKYSLHKDFNVWFKKNKTEFNYSDGGDSEQRIFEVLKNTKDLSISSIDLPRKIFDWPSEYHFSPVRHNLFRPFQIRKNYDILELGAGCGAITRQLGETGAKVIAVEGSLRRASISRERCRELKNVEIVCDNIVNFRSIQKFDIITLIGVLEYAPVFIKKENSVNRLLEHIKKFLKPNGTLIIAIENKLGMKYFAGLSEDHIGIPFYGIQGLYQNNDPVTFSKSEIKNILNKNGFNHLFFFYPFPDYKLPNIILSDSGIEHNRINVGNLLISSFSRDYIRDYPRTFNEKLVWSNISPNELIKSFANSFLIFCSPNKRNPFLFDNWHAKLYSLNRPMYFGTCTTLNSENLKNGKADIKVAKEIIFKNIKYSNKDISLNFSRKNKYIDGTLYIIDLLKIMSREDGINEIIEWIKPWHQLLQKNVIKVVKRKKYLPAHFIDATPFNVIKDSKNRLNFFDLEWVYENQQENKNGILLDIVFFRGLLHSFSFCPYNKKISNHTLLSLILECMKSFGLFFDNKNDIYKVLPFDTDLFKIRDPEKIKDYIKSIKELLSKPPGVLDLVYNNIENKKAEIENKKAEIENKKAEIEKYKLSVQEQKLINESLNYEIIGIQNSISWKITWPLRYTKEKIIDISQKVFRFFRRSS